MDKMTDTADTPTKTMQALQSDLLTAMADFVRAEGDDDVKRLAGPLLDGDMKRLVVPARDHPAIAYLPNMRETLLPSARPLFQALLAASASLAWQVSYKKEDGFGDEYLSRYAWCDIIGPEGIFLSDEYRIGFGFWREGLFYPPHSHEPEEIYWVMSGTGVFKSGDAPPASKGPGSIIHHESGVWHSIDMKDSAVLVFFLWKGASLHKLSAFESGG